MMEIFNILLMTVITQLYVFVKIPRTVHVKRVKSTVCKLNVNKPKIKQATSGGYYASSQTLKCVRISRRACKADC